MSPPRPGVPLTGPAGGVAGRGVVGGDGFGGEGGLGAVGLDPALKVVIGVSFKRKGRLAPPLQVRSNYFLVRACDSALPAADLDAAEVRPSRRT